MTQFETPYLSPQGPEGLIETDHLHYLIARLRRSQTICLGQIYGPQLRRRHARRQRFVSRWLQASRDLARLGRELFKLEKHNHFIKTKWKMLRSPEWRARGFKELGGAKVMQSRERRLTKAKMQKPEPRLYGPQIILPAPKTSMPPFTKRTSVKTDSAGQFRLAVIPRGPGAWRLSRMRWRTRTYSWDSSWEVPKVREFPPIPVTPEELRGEPPLLRERSRERSELRVRGAERPQSNDIRLQRSALIVGDQGLHLSALEPMAGGTCPAVPARCAGPTSPQGEVKKIHEKPP